jgi:D-lactate dehydrogenase (cytochrome)
MTGVSDAVLADLLDAVGGDRGRVSSGVSDLDLHSADMTFHAPVRPSVVVYPTRTEEVAGILAIADEHRIAVTPFGAGSSLEGHVIPLAGGISLDLTRMDRILAIEPENLLAVVQTGVTRNTLNRAVGERGLQFPVDPGADATLGGMAATNASGTTTVRYGKMRANVLALEAVLPGGRVIRTGSRAPKTSAGYDLTSLLVGAEGTLGVIAELTLRLHGIPEHAVAVRVSFPTVDAAVRTAVAAVSAGANWAIGSSASDCRGTNRSPVWPRRRVSARRRCSGSSPVRA